MLLTEWDVANRITLKNYHHLVCITMPTACRRWVSSVCPVHNFMQHFQQVWCKILVPCTGYLGDPADTCISTDAPSKLGSTCVVLVLVAGQDCQLCPRVSNRPCECLSAALKLAVVFTMHDCENSLQHALQHIAQPLST